MNPKQIATKNSMDIPHVTTVELPLNVKNTDAAILMLGGKQTIAAVINSSIKSGSQTAAENTMELKLRKDPFHHPIQSSFNSSEKVLLKISIPKKSLPADYYSNPKKYPVQHLIKLNEANSDTPNYKLHAVAIVDKTYSFKSIADFQITTKNNSMVQEFNQAIPETNNFKTIQKYFAQNQNFNGISDYKDTDKYYNNFDHQLPPPPILSPIKYPFDFKYQKNPFTTAIKDVESGEIKVVSTKNTLKLYTKMIDYNTNDIPTTPAPELVENLKTLESKPLPVNVPEFYLQKCIEWLRQIFDIKPIWLRKQLEDIVLPDLKKFIKQALPYVSYIYKSGPWRFCNVKFSINPKSDSSFWIYQSEYFRIPGLKFVLAKDSSNRVVPNTLNQQKEITVSEYLFFNGITLPSTVTYQIGDILDLDITTILKDHRSKMGSDFLREIPDFQDGWINRQTMEVIRRIIRYKLNRIVKEESIDQNKIIKILDTTYVETDEIDEKSEMADAKDYDESRYEDARDDEADDEFRADEEIDIEVKEEEDILEDSVENEGNLLKKLDQLNNDTSSKLSQLIGFIKQDSIEE